MQKKRTYEKPQMTDLGEVNKLTLANQDGAALDAYGIACQEPLFS
jgi:hypothetical protein